MSLDKIFSFGVKHSMGFLRSFIKGLLIFAVGTVTVFIITYHTAWFQKKYLYPLPYREIVFDVAQQYEVDPHLIYAVIRTESKYVSTATSPRGARGLMQIMPETGAWIADKLKVAAYSQDRLYDPAVNLEFGTWYLATLRDEFDGNPVMTLAAYNGGRGNVKEWKEQYGWADDFNNINQIPFSETRIYVNNVLAAYNQYNKLYGATQ
jgi:soluble lytic murein transglycosylase